MEIQAPPSPKRVSQRYTARHRHQLPGRGYTSWSEGVANGRHSHTIEDTGRAGFVGDSVGSPVHRHAWNVSTPRRVERGYTSGPVLDGPVTPAVSWISRVLRR